MSDDDSDDSAKGGKGDKKEKSEKEEMSDDDVKTPTPHRTLPRRPPPEFNSFVGNSQNSQFISWAFTKIPCMMPKALHSMRVKMNMYLFIYLLDFCHVYMFMRICVYNYMYNIH